MNNKQVKELLQILKACGVQYFKRGILEVQFKETGVKSDNSIRAISEPITVAEEDEEE